MKTKILMMTAVLSLAIVFGFSLQKGRFVNESVENTQSDNNSGFAKTEGTETAKANNAMDRVIFQEIETMFSYASDPTIPENLLNGINRHIVKVRVDSVDEARFLPETEFYSNPYMPSTPIKVEVLETLYGEEVLLENDTIYMFGGDIRISQLVPTLDEVDMDRFGICDLSAEERDRQYMRFSTEFSYDLQPGQEYILIVTKLGDGLYQIATEGCGVFTENKEVRNTNAKAKSLSMPVLKNVITDVEIAREELVLQAEANQVDVETYRNDLDEPR